MGRHTKLLPLALMLVISFAAPAWAQDDGTDAPDEPWIPDRPWEAIDLVIALDTSDSMQNLIDAARLSLWDIVNDLQLAEPRPTLRVGLLAYGSPAYDRDTGWVRVETDLTTDLDFVSERLFELTTSGGSEYVGRALQTAVEELSWVPSYDTLKLVFVAGNEPADQDPEVDFRDAGLLAADHGISVTVIFCGSPNQEQAETWKELALEADGRFAAIDHRGGPVVVRTPYDQELAQLGAALNDTFIPLGETGRERQRNLARQDTNASKLSPAAAAARARTKAMPGYSAGWDLISALESGRSLDEIDVRDLPEALQRMSVEEREAYVAEQRATRARLQQEIAELTAKRQRSMIEQVEAKGLDMSKTFDSAVRESIRSQVREKGFDLPER